MYFRILAAASAVFSGAAISQEAAPDAGSATPASVQQPVTAEPPAVAQPVGKIVMYRGSSIMGAGIACPIRYKGQEVIELARGKYGEWDVPPGRYILNNKTASVEVSVAAGETRYVRCMIKPGFLSGRADLQVVDAESFNEHRSEFTQKPVASVLAASGDAPQ